jgi:CheY-like chemotaxis protein
MPRLENGISKGHLQVEIDRNLPKQGAGKIALVADDTALLRERLVGAFLSDGFETFSAKNGKEAIEVVSKIKPHIIVLDLSMPVMNGLEAASQLRRSFPKTPIILSTLYAGALSNKDAYNAGISVVLPKTAPFPLLIENARELMEE